MKTIDFYFSNGFPASERREEYLLPETTDLDEFFRVRASDLAAETANMYFENWGHQPTISEYYEYLKTIEWSYLVRKTGLF